MNKSNNSGFTPVYVASLGGHAAILTMLLEHGGDVHQANHVGTTPVYMAAYHGHAGEDSSGGTRVHAWYL